MSERITGLRCSALPAALKCPGTVRAPDLEIEEESDAADLGTATHELLASYVTTGLVGDVDGTAARYKVDKGELGRLFWYGRQTWEKLRDSFPYAEAEEEMSTDACRLLDDLDPNKNVILTGHLDVLGLAGVVEAKHGAIVDWKTGRVDYDYSDQLRGYAALMFGTYPWLETVQAGVAWLRDQDFESYTFTRQDIKLWLRRLIAHVVDWDGVYKVGEHCGFCRRSHECPALAARVRRDIAIFENDSMASSVERGLADIPAARVVELRRKARLISRFLESFDKAVRLRVEQDGELKADDGKTLKLVPEPHRAVDALKAWPVLQEHLSDEEIADCVKISVSKVETTVAAKVGKGKGAAAKREVNEALRSAGAVTDVQIMKLREVRG